MHSWMCVSSATNNLAKLVVVWLSYMYVYHTIFSMGVRCSETDILGPTNQLCPSYIIHVMCMYMFMCMCLAHVHVYALCVHVKHMYHLCVSFYSIQYVLPLPPVQWCGPATLWAHTSVSWPAPVTGYGCNLKPRCATRVARPFHSSGRSRLECWGKLVCVPQHQRSWCIRRGRKVL